MSTKPQNVKGMRDLLPPAMMLRQHIIQTLRNVFERYGFEPLQTPTLEHAETLEGKLGDEERLIYRFEDHGGRKLAMRYDQTVPLARVVAQYQSQLQLPWRRYAVGASYRGERTQRGRYREFYQADVDIVGSASPVADAEIIAVLTDALSALGFDNFVTLLSHRQILGGIARVSGLDEAAAGSVYRAIDKLDKIGADGVRSELMNSGVSAAACDRILHLVSLNGDSESVLNALATALVGDERAQAAIVNLREIIAAASAMGVPSNRYAVAPRLARGLSYYTGMVCEAVVESPPMGSLLGGGRYDDLIGLFAEKSLPTVGIAFGLDRLHDVMEELGMGPQGAMADVFVTVFNSDCMAGNLAIAHQLRAAGLKVEVALDSAERLGKQLQTADRRGIALAVVQGPDEQAAGEVVVRDLKSGTQHRFNRTTLVDGLRGLLAGEGR
ncbi:MAG: histidine--tRNA ligase [Roseiflexaceae bacterium]|jgi:histidyl-tRNA synthetase|nr:histidine--tRNA ligase [Chloroflexaceae bacterium]